MSEPTCRICSKGGHGIQFPMIPKTEGFKFGQICAECDDVATTFGLNADIVSQIIERAAKAKVGENKR